MVVHTAASLGWQAEWVCDNTAAASAYTKGSSWVGCQSLFLFVAVHSLLPTYARLCTFQRFGACRPASTQHVIAANLDVGRDGRASLLVAHGSAKPAFQRFALPAPGEAPARVTLQPVQVSPHQHSLQSVKQNLIRITLSKT